MSFPAPHHLTGDRGIWRGATWTRRITWSDDGVPVSLAGKTVTFTVTDGAGVAVLTLTNGAGVTIIDEPGGVFDVEITAAQTASVAVGQYGYTMSVSYAATVLVLMAGSFESRATLPA